MGRHSAVMFNDFGVHIPKSAVRSDSDWKRRIATHIFFTLLTKLNMDPLQHWVRQCNFDLHDPRGQLLQHLRDECDVRIHSDHRVISYLQFHSELSIKVEFDRYIRRHRSDIDRAVARLDTIISHRDAESEKLL